MQTGQKSVHLSAKAATMTYKHIGRFVGMMWMSASKKTAPLFNKTKHPTQSCVKFILLSSITSHTGVLGLQVDRAPSHPDSRFPAQACTRGFLETTKQQQKLLDTAKSIAGGQSTVLVSCIILHRIIWFLKLASFMFKTIWIYEGCDFMFSAGYKQAQRPWRMTLEVHR